VEGDPKVERGLPKEKSKPPFFIRFVEFPKEFARTAS
jgi:hypothetical protein